MCDVWPNADGGSTAGHGFSTSQEVSDHGAGRMSESRRGVAMTVTPGTSKQVVGTVSACISNWTSVQ